LLNLPLPNESWNSDKRITTNWNKTQQNRNKLYHISIVVYYLLYYYIYSDLEHGSDLREQQVTDAQDLRRKLFNAPRVKEFGEDNKSYGGN